MIYRTKLKKSGKIQWFIERLYVDLDTGELLTKNQLTRYRILHKLKKIIINYETVRTIRYTNECRKLPAIQQSIW